MKDEFRETKKRRRNVPINCKSQSVCQDKMMLTFVCKRAPFPCNFHVLLHFLQKRSTTIGNLISLSLTYQSCNCSRIVNLFRCHHVKPFFHGCHSRRNGINVACNPVNFKLDFSMAGIELTS